MAHDADRPTTEPGAPEDIDPAAASPEAGMPQDPMSPVENADAPQDAAPEAAAEPQDTPDEAATLRTQLEERTNDLKRLQAEYVNYKRRVDRDRDLSRLSGVESVVVDLVPLLDNLRTARQHEELSGGFKLLAEELERVATKHKLEAYGEKDDPFDPQIHDALMQANMPGITEPTCIDVMQVGYRLGGRVIRPARVAVALPAE
ncbi:nucleotide exchange factor GrpE [Mariniluteicoccus flavus]